jgi:hypothetical protein
MNFQSSALFHAKQWQRRAIIKAPRSAAEKFAKQFDNEICTLKVCVVFGKARKGAKF